MSNEDLINKLRLLFKRKTNSFSRHGARPAGKDINKMDAKTNLAVLRSDRPNISVGRYTYGNPKIITWMENDSVSIGSFCSIADEVVILGGGEHRSDWITTSPIRVMFNLAGAWYDGIPYSKGETRIGNDVWIGYRAMILSGITIGDGAVIGAGAVVAKDVPPYGIAAGNPASVLKYRFNEPTRELLLEARWWDWPLERIIDNVGILCGDNIESLKTLLGK